MDLGNLFSGDLLALFGGSVGGLLSGKALEARLAGAPETRDEPGSSNPDPQAPGSDSDGTGLRGLTGDRNLTIRLADEIDPAQRLGELEARCACEPEVLAGCVPGAQMTLSDGAT